MAPTVLIFYSHNPQPQVLQHLPQVLCVVEGGLVVAQSLVWVRLLGFLSQDIVPASHQDREILPVRFQGFIILPHLNEQCRLMGTIN